MNKKFLNAILFGALALTTATFTGCKDYDDDINNLSGRVDAVEKSLTELKSDFGALSYVSSVTYDDASRKLTVTTKGGATQTYTISDADTKPGVDTNTTYTLSVAQDGNKYTVTLKGSDGSTSNVTITDTDTDTDTDTKFDVNSLFVKEIDGKSVVCYGNPDGEFGQTGVIIPKHEGAVITTLKDTEGKVIGYTITENGESSTLLIQETKLTSLVFAPDFYYSGIEAMAAASYEYKALTVGEVSADENGSADKGVVATGTETTVSVPGMVATYHLNPSTVDPALLAVEKLAFIGGNKEVKAAEEAFVAPKVVESEVANGILTVRAKFADADIKNIATDQQVTVLALQVDNDEVVTSDYAAVYKTARTEFALANAKSKDAHKAHLYTTAAEAIANEPLFDVAWDSEGEDVADYVETHYKESGKTTCSVLKVADAEFEYVYELVGYIAGKNETSESAHAALNGSIVRPQMTEGGKQDTTDPVQSQATIGRMPLVRVTLVDTNNDNQVVAVGYIKFVITATQVEPTVTEIPAFTFNDNYTASCTDADDFVLHSLTWNQVTEKILAELNVSKADFEANYELELADGKPAQFMTKEGKFVAADPIVGYFGITTDDTGAEMTNVLKWRIEEPQVYEYFIKSLGENGDAYKSISRSVRFKHKTIADTYVYVTFAWTPEALKVNPTGTLANENRIKENWFAQYSNVAGSGYAEIHQHVKVPVSKDDRDCTYANDLLDVFEGGVVKVSGIDEDYVDFQDAKLTKNFTFIVPEGYEFANGNDGNTYKLTVDAYNGVEGTALMATKYVNNATTGDAYTVAVIEGTNVRFAERNDVAKALLNNAGHKELAKGETLTARIQVAAVNGCDKTVELSNNEFDVRFLRPIDLGVQENPGSLEDGVNAGSDLDLSKVLKFSDWRDEAFSPKDYDYFAYYGVTAINIDTDAITTDLNGADFKKTLKEIKPKASITYTPASAIKADAMGKLNYKNGGEVIGDFNIKVPVTVTYKWGVVKEEIVIAVKSTVGQN